MDTPATLRLPLEEVDVAIALYADQPIRIFRCRAGQPVREYKTRRVRGTLVVRISHPQRGRPRGGGVQRSHTVASLLTIFFEPGPAGAYLASTDNTCSLSSMVWRHRGRARGGEPAIPKADARECASKNSDRPLAFIRPGY